MARAAEAQPVPGVVANGEAALRLPPAEHQSTGRTTFGTASAPASSRCSLGRDLPQTKTGRPKGRPAVETLLGRIRRS